MRRLASLAAGIAIAAGIAAAPAVAARGHRAAVVCISRAGRLYARTGHCRPGERLLARQAAGSSAGTELIYACVNRHGELRIVGSRHRCGRRERRIRWAAYSPPPAPPVSLALGAEGKLGSEETGDLHLAEFEDALLGAGTWRGIFVASMFVKTEAAGAILEGFCSVSRVTGGVSTEIGSAGFTGVSAGTIAGYGEVGEAVIPIAFTAAQSHLEVICARFVSGKEEEFLVHANLQLTRIG